MFDSFNESIDYIEHGVPPKHNKSERDTEFEEAIALGPSTKNRKTGAQAYMIDQTDNGEVIEYNNYNDSGKRII